MLPRINDDKPIYELKLPTNGKTYKYRPFLVKEQRNILMASESGSAREGIMSMLQCIESCAPEAKISELSTTEIDYIFLQIRGKSVGEKSEINLKCKKCDLENPIEINLSEVEIKGYKKEDTVELTDKIKLKMKYTTYDDSVKNIEKLEKEQSAAELIFTTLKISLHSLEVDDELIMFADESEEEIDQFLNSLTSEQLNKCVSFIEEAPGLNYQTEFTCLGCEEHNEVSIERFQDFF